jgi:hypothetical protein
VNNGYLVVSVFAIIVSAIGVFVSYLVAKKYGDRAATDAMIEFHRKEAQRARLTTLRLLQGESRLMREVVDFHCKRKPQAIGEPMPKLPVDTLRAALAPGSPMLPIGSELENAVRDYFSRADKINSLVDMYMHASQDSSTAENVGDICRRELIGHGILDRLDEALANEFEAAGS